MLVQKAKSLYATNREGMGYLNKAPFKIIREPDIVSNISPSSDEVIVGWVGFLPLICLICGEEAPPRRQTSSHSSPLSSAVQLPWRTYGVQEVGFRQSLRRLGLGQAPVQRPLCPSLKIALWIWLLSRTSHGRTATDQISGLSYTLGCTIHKRVKSQGPRDRVACNRNIILHSRGVTVRVLGITG